VIAAAFPKLVGGQEIHSLRESKYSHPAAS
jgi:hypothetical protein